MTVIYEPLYLEGQQLTESAFKQLRIEDNSRAAWREFRILVDFWRRGDHQGKDKIGIFSPKFGMKTKVSAQRFIEFSEASAADVCFINPFPQIRYYSYNVWMQGEANHPGLMARAQALLDASGVAIDVSSTPRNDARTLCYSNFWVGSEQFWDEYVGGVLEPIARFLESNPTSEVSRSVLDATWHSDPAPFLPFIVERLFSTFLAIRRDISARAYPIDDPEPYCASAYEWETVKFMRPMVDAADSTGSFPQNLKRAQGLCCEFLVACGRIYYETNAHPHTGRTIKAD